MIRDIWRQMSPRTRLGNVLLWVGCLALVAAAIFRVVTGSGPVSVSILVPACAIAGAGIGLVLADKSR